MGTRFRFTSGCVRLHVESFNLIKMSMLAESRRKIKYGTDPRGENWAQDQNKFGQKLMEKFGWAKGKGLGANEDGNTEHVKVSHKQDTRGVGCTKKHADNWIAHQDDFNSLLSSLNAENQETSCDKPPITLSDKDAVQNLEHRSKSSKSRVHYGKFAAWKDLSKRDSEDFDCIFGRRKSANNTPTTQSAATSAVNSDDESPSEAPAEIGSEKSEFGVTTIQTGTSVQDYFKAKMAAIKEAQIKRSNESETSPISNSEKTADADCSSTVTCGFGFRPELGCAVISSDDVEERKKSKKSKKDKKRSRCDLEDVVSIEQIEKQCSDSGDRQKKKKHKREKSKDDDQVANGKIVSDEDRQRMLAQNTENECADKAVSSESDVDASRKKKKKRKNITRKEEDGEESDVKIKHKKRKSCERKMEISKRNDKENIETRNGKDTAVDRATQNDSGILDRENNLTKETKKSKKNKSHSSTDEISKENKEKPISANIDECKIKKKKKKNNKKNVVEENGDEIPPEKKRKIDITSEPDIILNIAGDESHNNINIKKKEKKRKRKRRKKKKEM